VNGLFPDYINTPRLATAQSMPSKVFQRFGRR